MKLKRIRWEKGLRGFDEHIGIAEPFWFVVRQIYGGWTAQVESPVLEPEVVLLLNGGHEYRRPGRAKAVCEKWLKKLCEACAEIAEDSDG